MTLKPIRAYLGAMAGAFFYLPHHVYTVHGPCSRATKLYVKSFDHGSYGNFCSAISFVVVAAVLLPAIQASSLYLSGSRYPNMMEEGSKSQVAITGVVFGTQYFVVWVLGILWVS